MSQYGAGCVWNTGSGRCSVNPESQDDELCYMGPKNNCRRRAEVSRPAMVRMPQQKTMGKRCPAGKVRNPQTGRCVIIGGPTHRHLVEAGHFSQGGGGAGSGKALNPLYDPDLYTERTNRLNELSTPGMRAFMEKHLPGKHAGQKYLPKK